MSSDEKVFLSLGREVVRMINDIRKVTKGDFGYARRCLTFPGGEVHVIVANDKELADLFERAAANRYEVESVTPPSQRN